MRDLIYKYRHGWVLLYLFIYMPWFNWLEKTVTKDYTVIHILADDYVPFVELFVIPYFVWFAYIFIVGAYFFLVDAKEFYRYTAFLFIGMTICLTIYTIWPNGHDLRLDLTNIGRDNIFIRIMSWLYSTDTCTNVCPSIHAFNSIGASIAILKSEHLRNARAIRIGSVVLSASICMSTVFLKQHSVFDVVCAFALGFLMYLLVYAPNHSTWLNRLRTSGAASGHKQAYH